MQFEWKGVFPALTTPFTAIHDIDLPRFEKKIAQQAAAGVHGLVIGGTLGEASVLTADEKEKLVRSAVAATAGRIPVIMNIAEGATRDAITQAREAEEWGASGLMLLPPMRYKSDHRETVRYFLDVAASTVLPIMIYNNPIDYRIEVTMDMFDELQTAENITAVKESTRDVTNVTRMRNRFGERFAILCGVDTIALEELCLGADGWVAGLVCAFPDETVAIYEWARSGKLEDAIRLYRWFMPLLELDIHPKLVQYIKLAETEAGCGTEFVRPPRLTLEGEERERILKIIRDALACRPAL